jgi:COP9 signalosome complex subunit 6
MSTANGLELKLHPLVIVNVSDHFTRIRAQTHSHHLPRVLGCLLGIQTGRSVEIFNSFELKYDVLDELIVLDRGFLTQKQEQYKKVFPKYDILGWYSTGTGVQVADMQVHKALADINESPLYMLLDPTINHGAKDLPITIFESELHVIEGVPTPIFVKSVYTIETVEAERISVDHVARITPSGGSSGATQLAAHLMGLHSAIKMLSRRIKVLHHLLLSFSKGELPIDHSLLRQVSSLVRRLPAIDSAQFQEEFLTEYNDTLLMTYLAGITKGTSTLNELVEKFNVAYEKHSRRGGRQAAFI